MLCKRFVVFLILLTGLTGFFGCYSPYRENIIRRAKQEGIPIIVSEITVYAPNSVGGVDVGINIINTSNYAFKYVILTLVPYNRVGDIAPSHIGNRTNANIKIVGSIEPYADYLMSIWENVWDNGTIDCVKLENIEIMYMNDKVEIVRGHKLTKVLSSNVNESICR